jgi:hypothetical protein
MDKPMHTPTPWRLSKSRKCLIVGGVDEIANTSFIRADDAIDSVEANAALIVKAVNSHAAMKEALEKLVKANENDAHEAGMTYASLETQYALETARAALSLCEVK